MAPPVGLVAVWHVLKDVETGYGVGSEASGSRFRWKPSVPSTRVAVTIQRKVVGGCWGKMEGSLRRWRSGGQSISRVRKRRVGCKEQLNEGGRDDPTRERLARLGSVSHEACWLAGDYGRNRARLATSLDHVDSVVQEVCGTQAGWAGGAN